jgi:hypothetical protein
MNHDPKNPESHETATAKAGNVVWRLKGAEVFACVDRREDETIEFLQSNEYFKRCHRCDREYVFAKIPTGG